MRHLLKCFLSNNMCYVCLHLPSLQKIVVLYYLADDSVQVTEPKQDNSGIPQVRTGGACRHQHAMMLHVQDAFKACGAAVVVVQLAQFTRTGAIAGGCERRCASTNLAPLSCDAIGLITRRVCL